MNTPTRQSVLSFGISLDESRKKRETQTLSLRKKAREEMLSKRRQIVSSEPQINVNLDNEVCILLFYNMSFRVDNHIDQQ